ncbi:aminodeoxychorismate synthase component I [Effusibacillus dendaii]|uniref:Aminodeoxychorismate synthase, component I n=1 Tax=Effusibacillus dendaii TaxID=2743772 RepID=A0A7I8D8Z7_9BACL|nr:aminodeoxychorismate synthase component I [Effusibacillus dendaii]BCJ86555.1 aminodeoxychorismate synthase, component I [Effusibacillus dendaii]
MFVLDFENERMIFKNPQEIWVANTLEEVIPCLNQVQEAINQGFYAVGYIAYEAAPAFDPKLTVKNGNRIPLLWFGLFKEPSADEFSITDKEFTLSEWVPSIGEKEYIQHIAAIKNAISNGETYQVNYTIRLRSRFTGSDVAFYSHLRKFQQGNYSAYLNLGRYRILSASPELFFKVENGNIKVKPMKGTSKRGRWLEEDQTQAEWLAKSEKNRAENVMIADLLRSDLGKIAETGTVSVSELFAIEKYPTVFQMVSQIEGKLRQDVSITDIFKSLFPCGSITGAPKAKTMEWIAELEDCPRDIYCGTIGLIKPSGEMIFNVAIRTVLLDMQTGLAEFGAGGGVTWDSTADGEYEEAILKTALLKEPQTEFELLETMKLNNDRYFLLHHHLNRLQKSAAYFGIPIDEKEVLDALRQHADLHQGETRRVRLLVSNNGGTHIESVPLSESPAYSLPIRIAKDPVSRFNRFLCHKTTFRTLYDRHRTENPGVFDILLWNEEGEITEFTFGNVVLEIGGKKLTPRLESGLLAGTFRQYLIENGKIAEQVLKLEDLKLAERIWFINSVREWVPVYIVK